MKNTSPISVTLPHRNTPGLDCLRNDMGFLIMARIDLSGQRFGRLLVIGYSQNMKGTSLFECICDCGTSKDVRSSCLRRGVTKSCGCLAKELLSERAIHGHCIGKKTAEYNIWSGIKKRCLIPNNKDYARYGGRGITICDEWKDSFPQFLKDMGKKPFPTASIDRIDNDGNYEPSNCRWATRTEQQNNRRDNVIIKYKGKNMTLSEWAKLYNIKKTTLRERLYRYGFTMDQAVSKKNYIKID